ncbi:MAG: hypothetical protein AAGB13_17420 [Cyanobacteria bacterium P01_F01_bin.33]
MSTYLALELVEACLADDIVRARQILRDLVVDDLNATLVMSEYGPKFLFTEQLIEATIGSASDIDDNICQLAYEREKLIQKEQQPGRGRLRVV